MTGRAVLLSQTIAAAQVEQNLLERAVHDHARLVYRIAYSVLRNHHDAEDATQEVFLRALRHQDQLAKADSPKHWLARIAWRVSVERRKSAVMEPISEEIEKLRSSLSAADEMLIVSESRAILEKVIPGLPAKLRDPLVLSTVEDMSPADISEVLGIGESAVRSRLFRARQLLRERLAGLIERTYGT